MNDRVFGDRLLFIEDTPYDNMNVLITSSSVRDNQQEARNRHTCEDLSCSVTSDCDLELILNYVAYRHCGMKPLLLARPRLLSTSRHATEDRLINLV